MNLHQLIALVFRMPELSVAPLALFFSFTGSVFCAITTALKDRRVQRFTFPLGLIAGFAGGQGAYYHKDPPWFTMVRVFLASIPRNLRMLVLVRQNRIAK